LIGFLAFKSRAESWLEVTLRIVDDPKFALDDPLKIAIIGRQCDCKLQALMKSNLLRGPFSGENFIEDEFPS
jgi:hypothetical protein